MVRKSRENIMRHINSTGIALAAVMFALPVTGTAAMQDDDSAARMEQRHAPIHDAAQLDDHLRLLAPTSPLASLSEPARNRFIASLRFNESGLVSFHYRDIEKELNPVQAYRLLALFGAQRTIGLIDGLQPQSEEDARILEQARRLPPDDHDGYACAGRATCSTSINSICMSGC